MFRFLTLMIWLTAFTFAVCNRCFAASIGRDQICDINADYALGIENYPLAVRLYRAFLRSHPASALAHYHLGFAYGMLGNDDAEVAEYQRAVALGLNQWDLFLNLGLALAEHGDQKTAEGMLLRAVARAPQRADTHFNLAIVYERGQQLTLALKEIQVAVGLQPGDAEGRNQLAVINAEMGNYEAARKIWSGLARSNPDYVPARENLEILDALLSAPPPSVAPAISPLQPFRVAAPASALCKLGH
ncbi:MAG TPA: tetratricopeptide repeat protein [Candidatus Binataceae bacterium]|nr:tetratricopeptide repeat protein [Candidatus Binataceae bacterium]